jgi:Peptidase A4 family
MRKFRFYLAALASLWGASIPLAHAQVTRPTNIPGIAVVAAPPPGFDPVAASPAKRKQYAIPPMPDQAAAPAAYQRWLKAVSRPQNRASTPVLSHTNIYNGPIRDKNAGAPVQPGNNNIGSILSNGLEATSNNVVQVTSSNWSGPSIVSSGTPFALEAIAGEFVVPTAHQPFGQCTGDWVYSAQWAGIDGNNSNDVLQAGVEVDAYCNNKVTATAYSAWIEWYPFAETQVSSPAIHPGDLIYVQVWNTSSTVAYAYFYNYSTQETATYQLTAPTGTTLQGNSIEWIVERPSLGASLARLTNYIDVSWPWNVAWNYQASTPTYHYPGDLSIAAPFTLDLITMLGNGGNAISYGSPQNLGFLYFEDAAGAHGIGPVAPYN